MEEKFNGFGMEAKAGFVHQEYIRSFPLGLP
jgi:hypothetical protein